MFMAFSLQISRYHFVTSRQVGTIKAMKIMKPEDLRNVFYLFCIGPGLYSSLPIPISHHVCNHMYTYNL